MSYVHPSLSLSPPSYRLLCCPRLIVFCGIGNLHTITLSRTLDFLAVWNCDEAASCAIGLTGCPLARHADTVLYVHTGRPVYVVLHQGIDQPHTSPSLSHRHQPFFVVQAYLSSGQHAKRLQAWGADSRPRGVVWYVVCTWLLFSQSRCSVNLLPLRSCQLLRVSRRRRAD